jgi:hypothetical protein
MGILLLFFVPIIIYLVAALLGMLWFPLGVFCMGMSWSVLGAIVLSMLIGPLGLALIPIGFIWCLIGSINADRNV